MLQIFSCINIDSRVYKNIKKTKSIEDYTGVYKNTPAYVSESKMWLVELSNFADVIGFPYNKPDSFRLIGDITTGLTVELLKEGVATDTQKYTFSEGLIFRADGMIELPRKTETGSDDEPVIGFATPKKILLYLNDQDDLVVVKTGGGTIIPLSSYGEVTGIFSRKKNEL